MATGHMYKRGRQKWLLVIGDEKPKIGKKHRRSKMFKGSKYNAKKEIARWIGDA